MPPKPKRSRAAGKWRNVAGRSTASKPKMVELPSRTRTATIPDGSPAKPRMRPPDELNGDEIAARRLFARLDASLRAAAKGRWSTAKRTRNAAVVNLDSEHGRVEGDSGAEWPYYADRQPLLEEMVMERDPSAPPDVMPDDDEETRPLTSPEAPDAPQPSAPQPQTPQTFPPLPEEQ
jgi:hypothetical protein